ncbi:zincin-like metallopeptidase domain-containing protein [Chryseobacterium antibioticum]|uniref:Zincin-like metallopeptidase domain-containing protein n=1 Tax=Chryseobacterium pyrolae TaxID=2987481 RepID=A0ABT2IN12_9FLAO|nr:zincin-like metallopeptidase domain-containing protein [Chryseobacterium pyrolae]MCT2410051.1 zincin-like metallopeptidase domain-containing protein [Chryseobacterium pyrolae]
MKTAYRKVQSKTTETKQDKFISKILENLDKVNVNDWEQYTKLESAYPCNLFTEQNYKGFNMVALFLDTIANGFTSAKYATFNSISKAGGKLQKGAKGCVIEFFSFIYKHIETGKTYTQDQVKEMTKLQQNKINKIPCLKNYTVFNSQFIENLSDLNLNIIDDQPEEKELEELQNCESFISKIITKGELDLRFGVDTTAYYSPALDYIFMPEKKYFVSTSKYYSILFHEIIHWTGNGNRLNRTLAGHKDKESYSFEELIAEMGAMLNCLQFGILNEFINSVRYLKSWANHNSQERETAIRNAFLESKRAKKFLEAI